MNHPLIADAQMNCGACPEEWEGHLADGQSFYYRLRWGNAGVGLGHTLDEAVADYDESGRTVCLDADGLRGQFLSDDERDQTFAALLQRATPSTPTG